MFGYVTASVQELTAEEKARYQAVYCGICRRIREQASQSARAVLSFDTAFLALLLMSLYEPEESTGGRACSLHPLKPHPWVDNEFIRYAADMNLALAYYNALDDWQDEGSLAARTLARHLEKYLPRERYPRQCQAIAQCIEKLHELEKGEKPNPDLCATVFGQLMGQLLRVREDLWADTLEQMGMGLGRFIYLADAAVDYRRDRKRGRFNPFSATGEDWESWESYLVLAMAKCTQAFEKLPLVQDKSILDNILYSGVWIEFRRRQKEARHDG